MALAELMSVGEGISSARLAALHGGRLARA